MSYTTKSMMAHAELHYATALKALATAEQGSTVNPRWHIEKAAAESQAGLLAVALANYALTETEL